MNDSWNRLVTALDSHHLADVYALTIPSRCKQSGDETMGHVSPPLSSSPSSDWDTRIAERLPLLTCTSDDVEYTEEPRRSRCLWSAHEQALFVRWIRKCLVHDERIDPFSLPETTYRIYAWVWKVLMVSMHTGREREREMIVVRELLRCASVLLAQRKISFPVQLIPLRCLTRSGSDPYDFRGESVVRQILLFPSSVESQLSLDFLYRCLAHGESNGIPNAVASLLVTDWNSRALDGLRSEEMREMWSQSRVPLRSVLSSESLAKSTLEKFLEILLWSLGVFLCCTDNVPMLEAICPLVRTLADLMKDGCRCDSEDEFGEDLRSVHEGEEDPTLCGSNAFSSLLDHYTKCFSRLLCRDDDDVFLYTLACLRNGLQTSDFSHMEPFFSKVASQSSSSSLSSRIDIDLHALVLSLHPDRLLEAFFDMFDWDCYSLSDVVVNSAAALDVIECIVDGTSRNVLRPDISTLLRSLPRVSIQVCPIDLKADIISPEE